MTRVALEIDGQVTSPLWALLLKLGADFDAPNALLWTARDILNELEIPFAQ